MRDAFDRGSKFLIGRHGDALLRLAGLPAPLSWHAAAAEVVQPRQLPDGLIEAAFADDPLPQRFVVEIATYPERRAAEQAVRDALLVYAHYRELPEVLTVVLRPKGQVRVTGHEETLSRRGWTTLNLTWRVVEMWTVSAAELLAANDVGLLPWVPLAHIDGPAEPVLRACRERIDRVPAADERANPLAVLQTLGRLRYDKELLRAIFFQGPTMIESPFLTELVAETRQTDILRVLKGRFGDVPGELTAALRKVEGSDALDALIDWAATCPDLAAFQARLPG